MKVRICDTKRLDFLGAQVKLYIPVCQGEETELVLTLSKADELGKDTIAKLKAIKCKGYYILKLVRIINRVTQSEMARYLSISLSTYRHKENHNKGSDFFLDEIVVICKKFDMSASLLFYKNEIIRIA